MIKFKKHIGSVMPIDIANIDTDTIIPKQFLKTVKRTGLGKHLFHNWRFIDDFGIEINTKFVMNQSRYKNANILLTRENFGCGSSREHAPWALIDYGFKTIIAPSFADIFYTNSFNNKLLLINLSQQHIDELFNQTLIHKIIYLTINLENQKIYYKNNIYSFKINAFNRYCIMNDLDIVQLTMIHEKMIIEYENKQPEFLK